MGKIERLHKLSTESGKIMIAAIDHRGLLKTMLHPENPELTTDEEIKKWKSLMVDLYKNRVSGLLIDPTYGRDLIDLSADCGWIYSMEQTGYRGGQEARATDLIPGWSVAKARELGASGVKLLLYFDPENRDLAREQKQIASEIGEACEREGMIFLLEPLTYKKSNDPYVVEHIVDEMLDLPIDIFKLEYPGSGEKCRRISDKVRVPWVLLSAGADYEQYKQQLKTACGAGAAGMAVGRAAWQEFGQYDGVARERFLQEVAVERIIELGSMVEEYADCKSG